MKESFVLSMRLLEEEIKENEITGDEFRSSVGEMFPPRLLINEERFTFRQYIEDYELCLLNMVLVCTTRHNAL